MGNRSQMLCERASVVRVRSGKASIIITNQDNSFKAREEKIMVEAPCRMFMLFG